MASGSCRKEKRVVAKVKMDGLIAAFVAPAFCLSLFWRWGPGLATYH
jgi:hypothetical protein